MAAQAEQRSTIGPEKWLAIVRRWCPAAPVELPITLVKSLIEAAASGSSGQLRLGLLEDFVLGLDAQLCSNAQKLNKLKMETARMAADPLRRPKLRPGHPAELAKAALAAVERAPDQVLSVEKIHTALRRVKPKIKRTSTYALVKRMADCGRFERDFAGVYGLPSRTRKPYEARTLQLLRLVYTAPGHEMGTAEALAVLGWSPKLLSATASELCSRKLLVKPEKRPRKVFRVPAGVVDKLERGEGILIAPGKVFYARPGGPPVDHSALVTLRPERPRIDPGLLGEKIVWLKTLKGEQRKGAISATAKEVGMDAAALEVLVVSKSELRAARKDKAKEQWRAEVTPLMQKCPERSPLPLPKLFKEVSSRIVGLTKRTFKDVLREQKVWLEQKGLKTSWDARGAPTRG
jgi:hypothetical protein